MRRDVAACYVVLCGVTALGLVHAIPVSLHMIVAATACIYIGAHGSVPALQHDHFRDDCERCKDDAKAGKAPGSMQPAAEQMQTRDAMMFPVYGSCVLFGLYLVFKFVAKEYVTVILKLYFFVIGVLVLGHRIKVISSSFVAHNTYHRLERVLFRFRLPRMPWESAPAPAAAAPTLAAASDATASVPAPAAAPAPAAVAADGGEDVTVYDAYCYVAAMGIAVCYVWYNHWALSNLLGVCFCIQGIELIGLGSYLNGCILLAGLFVYDVFWVFGTDVMVTVAKSFDAPIKLLFPQLDAALRPSMLGLGDIVIPGIFLALILRFDYSLKRESESVQDVKRSYFHTVLVAYVLGLLTTVVVMYAFDAAQPALLYLVPACLLSSSLKALSRGQWRQLWAFSESEDTPTAASATPAAAATSTASSAAAPADASARPHSE